MLLVSNTYVTIHTKRCILTTTDINTHLADLMVALKDVVCQWELPGTQLGLTYFKLKEIEKDKSGIQNERMREMLTSWLQGSGEECSKQALETALQKVDCRTE